MPNFHLVKHTLCFPLLVLKGIYHCWKYLGFDVNPGLTTPWLILIGGCTLEGNLSLLETIVFFQGAKTQMNDWGFDFAKLASGDRLVSGR